MREKLGLLIAGVIEALSALGTEVNVYFASQEKKKEADAERIAFLDNRSKDLDKREKPIKDFEQIGAKRAEADKLAIEAGELMGKARDAQDKFNAYATKTSAEIAKDKAANESRTAELNAEFAELAKQQAAFAKEQEDYKVKLAKRLVDSVS